MIFAFYVGLESDSVVADAIRDELQTGSRSHGAKQPNRTKP
jgi:hypothetical protein